MFCYKKRVFMEKTLTVLIGLSFEEKNTLFPKQMILTTPTGKPMGFLLPSLACNRTSFSDFGIQV